MASVYPKKSSCDSIVFRRFAPVLCLEWRPKGIKLVQSIEIKHAVLKYPKGISVEYPYAFDLIGDQYQGLPYVIVNECYISVY